jgi:UrcA family protein
MSMHFSQIGLVAALLTISFSTAQAEVSGDQSGEVVYGANPQTRIKQVPFGDLNLMNEDGREILIGRVSRAVDTVCGGRNIDPIDQREFVIFRHCRAESMADAMLKVQSVIDDVRNSRSVAAMITISPAGG